VLQGATCHVLNFHRHCTVHCERSPAEGVCQALANKQERSLPYIDEAVFDNTCRTSPGCVIETRPFWVRPCRGDGSCALNWIAIQSAHAHMSPSRTTSPSSKQTERSTSHARSFEGCSSAHSLPSRWRPWRWPIHMMHLWHHRSQDTPRIFATLFASRPSHDAGPARNDAHSSSCLDQPSHPSPPSSRCPHTKNLPEQQQKANHQRRRAVRHVHFRLPVLGPCHRNRVCEATTDQGTLLLLREQLLLLLLRVKVRTLIVALPHQPAPIPSTKLPVTPSTYALTVLSELRLSWFHFHPAPNSTTCKLLAFDNRRRRRSYRTISPRTPPRCSPR
jgi:hypothetical protein